MPSLNNAYTVGQINQYIKNMFSQDYLFRQVYVKGEASNVKFHSSGHIYFTLKDKTGSIACVMFAGNRKGLNFKLQDGNQIIVFGSIEVYERDGKYQLYAREITLDGAGALYERYEQLKRELEEMGMFAKEYKKPIPRYARKVGIVTASTGAAIQDIINISSRRNPYVQLVLYPAIVQGDAAAPSIVSGIRALEDYGVDVIIVGRGGGSIEDLWAFNEEIVARAIFDCSIPIVSAVGHETDTTIADYVADLRAPTPSAAAELTVFSYEDYLAQCSNYADSLEMAIFGCIANARNHAENLLYRLKSISPERRITEKRMYCISLLDKLDELMAKCIINRKHSVSMYAAKLDALSPLKRLQNGYALVDTKDGIINKAADVCVGQSINLHMLDGDLTCSVDDIMLINREEIINGQ